MMPANAHTRKKFTRMCFGKSEVTSCKTNGNLLLHGPVALTE